MKKFWGFVVKEFYHIFRDPRSLLILFGMPIIQVLLFGYVITNEIKDAKVAVLDQSKDLVTQKITQKMLSSGYFLLEKNLNGYSEIHNTFKQGVVKLVIVFEQDFAKKLERDGTAKIQFISDASDPNTANLLVNYANGIIYDYTKELNGTIKAPIEITMEPRMLYNPGLKGVFMFIPGIIGMLLMLISAMMTSISIAREKELGTMEVLLVSPMKPAMIVLVKVVPYFILSLVNAISVLLLGNFVFGVPIHGSLILLMSELMLFILMSLSLGILISTISPSQQVAMMISMMALMLPTMMLSGFIYPIENMPLPLQVVCQIMPPRWFIVIIKNIMMKGTGFEAVWKETLVLVGFTMLFILISIKKFKIRLE
jgi:ABC-2 type transport system permease protein